MIMCNLCFVNINLMLFAISRMPFGAWFFRFRDCFTLKNVNIRCLIVLMWEKMSNFAC